MEILPAAAGRLRFLRLSGLFWVKDMFVNAS
jgi:hypothetical protein